MISVDVFVGNYTIIDKEVYELWLDGFSAQEAVSVLKQRGILSESGATTELLMSDTLDHYRTYQMLERLLQYPTKFADQLTFQIDPQTQRHLIEKGFKLEGANPNSRAKDPFHEMYYEFDNEVVRELLGKKLSSRNRKDLDEVSDKTNVSLKSCRRQFDNVKRVFKTVEDLRGRLIQNIESHFLVSEGLARKYAAIVFITNNRFETGKRKLQYLRFDDFLHCSTHMIGNWSCSSNYCKQEDTDVDLDREYLQDLRDLKVLLEKDVLEEHKNYVCVRLKGKLTDRMYAEMESSFKNVSRSLVSIACGLNHNREARDIFVDFVEKFIEPCKQAKWTHSELEMFLNVYAAVVQELDAFKVFPQLRIVWNRYIGTASNCILCMFHS